MLKYRAVGQLPQHFRDFCFALALGQNCSKACSKALGSIGARALYRDVRRVSARRTGVRANRELLDSAGLIVSGWDDDQEVSPSSDPTNGRSASD